MSKLYKDQQIDRHFLDASLLNQNQQMTNPVVNNNTVQVNNTQVTKDQNMQLNTVNTLAQTNAIRQHIQELQQLSGQFDAEVGKMLKEYQELDLYNQQYNQQMNVTTTNGQINSLENLNADQAIAEKASELSNFLQQIYSKLGQIQTPQK